LNIITKKNYITKELENLNNKSTHGGKRDGAGRKEGSLSNKTKEQKVVEEEFRQRVMKSMEELINSQMNLAQGCQMLFKIEVTKDNKGKETRSKPELVTSQTTIEDYLAGELEDDDDYYFITTNKPDNKALDSLIDRVFGKSHQSIKLDGELGINLIFDETFSPTSETEGDSE